VTDKLRVALLTREYPPEVYGGAGVHVTYLARELAPLVDLTVHCQGADRPDAVAHRPWELLADANQALQVVSTDLSMAAAVGSAQLGALRIKFIVSKTEHLASAVFQALADLGRTNISKISESHRRPVRTSAPRHDSTHR